MSATQQQQRLDNRTSLYSEPRLSDAQVRTLRAAARATLRPAQHGWASGCGPEIFTTATVRSLVHKHGALSIHDRDGCEGSVDITPRGRKLLAAIAEANAEGRADD